VLGDTPQPGETPHGEDDPRSFADRDPAWWRGEIDRPTTPGVERTGVLLPPVKTNRTGETAQAHTAGARDTDEELRPAVERDHDQPDAFRYQPPQPPVDDVMVLPEPNLHHRPTVPLDHPMANRPPRPAVVPQVRPTEPLPPPTGEPATDARLERLENSPFWRDPVDDTIEVAPGEEPPPVLTRARHRGQGRAPRVRQAGLPVSAQASLVALGLVAAFFAWVSAEPFWLATGHGDQGYATTTRCTGDGVTQRCAGRFTSADGRYTMTQVRLLGVEGQARPPGAITPARMVSPDSRQAYLGGAGPLLHIRWLLGFALVLLCGYAIAGVTKARRLETPRARRAAVLLSLAGPVALLGGFLAAAY
jgi:hypothetical protein